MKNNISHLRSQLRNERGAATVETVPLMFVFVVLISYTLGMFGIIHTGIMQSISARAYAFETFKNRSNLVYFRDTPSEFSKHFKNVGVRLHGIASETRNSDQWEASARPLRVGLPFNREIAHSQGDSGDIHNGKVHDRELIGYGTRNEQVEVSPVWIMIQYGICIDNKCGDG